MSVSNPIPCPACATPAEGPDGLLSGFHAWAGPDKRGRRYFLCSSCGFVFLDPLDRPDARSERDRYLLHTNSPEDPGYRSLLLSLIDECVAPFIPGGASVLDYGSGPVPALASLLVERGYRARAWDPIFHDDPASLSARYVAVVLHEVIEHCFEPRDAVARAASCLQPDGILCVSTLFRPDTPEAFLRWWYREDLTHVSFFTDSCLQKMCGKAGLKKKWGNDRGRSVFRAAPS